MNTDVRLQAKFLLSSNIARLFSVSFCSFILRYGTLFLSVLAVYMYYRSSLFFFLLGNYNRIAVYGISAFCACMLLFFSLLFICSIRAGEVFVYFTRANGGYGKFSSLFRFIKFSRALKATQLYIQINIQKAFWRLFFLLPSVMCFACIYYLTQIAFSQKLVFILLYVGGALTLAIAMVISKISDLRFSASPYYMCLEASITPSRAIKKSILFTDGYLCDGVVLECSLIGWILSCFFIIPVIYAIPYIKLTKAVFVTDAVHARHITKATYPINILGLA